jgi:hypothetical protein
MSTADKVKLDGLIADGSVTTQKLADAAVTPAKTAQQIMLADGSRWMTGTLNLNGNSATGGVDPVQPNDLATRRYVDKQFGINFVALDFATIAAAAVAGQTVIWMNVNGGSGQGCPAGAVALGSTYQLNARFAAPGATLIKMSIGAPNSYKQFVDVPIDATSPPQITKYGSFGGDDYLTDMSNSFFQVRIEVQGSGVDLTKLTAGELVVNCAYGIPSMG